MSWRQSNEKGKKLEKKNFGLLGNVWAIIATNVALIATSSEYEIRFSNFFQKGVTYASYSCASDDVRHSFTDFWNIMGESDSKNLTLEQNGFES